MSLIKYVLFGFNFVLAVSGLALLIIDALVIADVNKFNHFIEGRVTTIPIVLIVTGIIIFLIASVGCYGAMRESPSLLKLYAVLLGIIFIIELALGIAAVAFKSGLESTLKQSLEETIKRSSDEDLRAWDDAQMKLKCCGVDRPTDWYDLSKNKTLRTSCCYPEDNDSITKDCKDAGLLGKDKYFQDGCVMKLKERIEINAIILIGVGIGIAFIQLLGTILICWLAYSIRRDRVK